MLQKGMKRIRMILPSVQIITKIKSFFDRVLFVDVVRARDGPDNARARLGSGRCSERPVRLRSSNVGLGQRSAKHLSRLFGAIHRITETPTVLPEVGATE